METKKEVREQIKYLKENKSDYLLSISLEEFEERLKLLHKQLKNYIR